MSMELQATLTSLAMVQGIQRKLGATRVLAKFATPLQLLT